MNDTELQQPLDSINANRKKVDKDLICTITVINFSRSLYYLEAGEMPWLGHGEKLQKPCSFWAEVKTCRVLCYFLSLLGFMGEGDVMFNAI